MSRFRAIEFGRATIQISTVGVSAVIAPNGVVQQQTRHFEPAQLIATTNLRTSLTPAAQFGAGIAWSVAVGAAITVGAGIVGARRHPLDM
jgi:apolipoprotein N-acyltransferase